MNEKELIELMEGNILARRKFNKILKAESASQLKTRVDTLIKYVKDMKPEPLETIEETIARKKPLMKLVEKIQQVIREKDAEYKLSAIQKKKQWVITEIPLHFHHTRLFRYCVGIDADMLRSGQSRPDQVKWMPLTSGTIEFKTRSGRTLKPNLLEVIPPKDWMYLLENPFKVLYYNTERNIIGFRNGKPTSMWNHPKDFREQQKIKPVVFPTYLAIMSV